MNRKQRDRNRQTASLLKSMAQPCKNFDQKGAHWVSTMGVPFAALVTGQEDGEGFWTSPRLYGPDGRRLSLES